MQASKQASKKQPAYCNLRQYTVYTINILIDPPMYELEVDQNNDTEDGSVS